MPQFAANIFYLFKELPFLDRFAAAARVGFKAIEYPYPYQVDLDESLDRLRTNNLQVATITAPVGDWQNGERGMAALPGREDEVKESLETAIRYADALSCQNIHVMSGYVGAEHSQDVAFDTFVGNLRFASGRCQPLGLNVLIEPINNTEQPHYFMGNLQRALDVIDRVAEPNLKLLYDLYHGAMNAENIDQVLERQINKVSHFQVAGFPGRAEPVAGEIDYPAVFQKIDDLGFGGWVGCEYEPGGKTEDGLGWANPYGIEPEKVERNVPK